MNRRASIAMRRFTTYPRWYGCTRIATGGAVPLACAQLEELAGAPQTVENTTNLVVDKPKR